MSFSLVSFFDFIKCSFSVFIDISIKVIIKALRLLIFKKIFFNRFEHLCVFWCLRRVIPDLCFLMFSCVVSVVLVFFRPSNWLIFFSPSLATNTRQFLKFPVSVFEFFVLPFFVAWKNVKIDQFWLS